MNISRQEQEMSAKAIWNAQELESDASWIYEFGPEQRQALRAALRQAPRREHLLDYEKSDFDIGSVAPMLEEALDQVKRGRGVAMIRGLPREDISEKEFELMTWIIGLHSGVARPQGTATQYLSAVRDAGTVYRSGKGRGYSSNAELDYHTDSSDLVFLSCYNRASLGGKSLTTSTLAAYEEMKRKHPGLLHWLHEPLHYSRQGEEAPDEGPTCRQPVYATANGEMFCRWNWNRMTTAQQLPHVPKLDAQHMEALKCYDGIVRQTEFAHHFWMEPGDLQIINSHRTLHSRTEFTDHQDPARKRLMFRLWIAPPDSLELPESYAELYRNVQAGSVRGGIRGRAYDARCAAYEKRQAAAAGLTFSA
jgi:hypothetical protein